MRSLRARGPLSQPGDPAGRACSLARILRLRDERLWGLILIVCVLGSYALNQSPVDVWVMLVAGAAGFVPRQARYPMGLLVLALVLGPMAESNLRRALVLSQGDLSIFFSRPIALVLLTITTVSLVWPLVRRRPRRGEQELHRYPACTVFPCGECAAERRRSILACRLNRYQA